MRGMIDGVWHSDLSQAPGWSDDLAQSFQTPASRVEIDIARLAAKPESYHLYAAHACPFAHRTLLARALMGVEGLGVTFADPWLGGSDGWHFPADEQGPVEGATAIWHVYAASNPTYSGRVTVPVLWDCEAGAIASAESNEILRALIAAYAGREGRPEIAFEDQDLSELCDWIVDRVNLGVYRIGFARNQHDYDQAYDQLLAALEELERRLGSRDYLWRNRLSLADLLLFPTAARFDCAYRGAFMILGRRWRDFPSLQGHLERMAQLPGVGETVKPKDYRRHYFDDGAFTVRHRGDDGHFIVPRTPDPF